MLLRRLIFAVLLAGAMVNGMAQLNVSATSNANTLINNIVGSGVIVTNVTLNCNGQASGTFTSSGTNLGLTSGIILATGEVSEAIGPNDSPGGNLFGGPGCFNADPTFFDPDLSNIEPQANYDGCVLEFNIKPVCSTLQIDYVFASEEYPEFVGAGYNDAFGFFISGPNPGGGTYSNLNIARIPGTGTAVSIDNINSGNNSSYFVDNSGGGSIQYDGFTTPLTASASVTPCATYHLKLVIADAGDCIYSSAVFLANKGITCPVNQVPSLTASSTPLNCGNDGTATVTVNNASGNITYNWQPSGQTTATATNLSAGTYTCTVGYSLPCPYTQTISVSVSGNNVLTLNTSTTNAYCNGATGTASVTVTGGTAPYSTPQWNTIPAQTGNSATNLIPGTYIVTVTDATGCTVTKAADVNNTTPTISANATVIQSTCNSPNGSIDISNITGGTQPYTFNWNTIPASNTEDLTNISAGVYQLIITDADNCKGTKDVTVNNIDSVIIDPYTLNEYCEQANGEIHVPVLNGVPPYTWIWSHDALLNDSVATNLSAGVYTFGVTDAVGCNSIGNATVVNIRDNFIGVIYTNPAEPVVNSVFTLGVSLPSNWTLDHIMMDDGSIRTDTNQVNLYYEEYGSYDAVFFMESNSGCKDTITYNIFVKDFMTIYIPNAFSPNSDRRNKVWYVYGTLVKDVTIYVYDRWGMLLFESHDLETGWDGTFKGKMCQEDVYIYKVEAHDLFNEKFRYVGHINLIR